MVALSYDFEEGVRPPVVEHGEIAPTPPASPSRHALIGSLSPHLFWWREGSLCRLPFAVKAGAFRFQPPDEFLDALNGAA